MKKIAALFLALLMALTAWIALAEDNEEVPYIDKAPEAAAFDSVWFTEDAEWRAEVYCEDDGVRLLVAHRLGDGVEDVWEYAALYHEDTRQLVTMPFGLHYQDHTFDADYSWTPIYEDGEAEFALNDTGRLIWNDLKDNAGEGLEFVKIGNFWHGRWVNGDIAIRFFDWYDGEYDIRLYRLDADGSILDNAIMKGPYDAENNAIIAYGCFDDGEEFTVTFGYDAENNLTWTQDGSTVTCEYDYSTDDL